MIRKRRTKFTTILMTLCLMAGMTLTMPGMSTKVQSADPPIPSPQFATKQDLLNSFDLDNSTDKSVAKVFFGQNDSGKAQEWYIAGKDTDSNNKNGLVLFAASPLKANQIFSDGGGGSDDKPYDENWECIYPDPDNPPERVYLCHYGGSELRNVLKGLEKNLTYFSESEQSKMFPTTIATTDIKNNVNYSTTDTLYAAWGTVLEKTDFIKVGANEGDEDDLIIHLSNLSGNSKFWLRSESPFAGLAGLFAQPGSKIINELPVETPLAVQPAFELNLDSLLFASTVPAATTEGALTAGEAFTLRYDAGTSLGTASINPSQTNVAVKIVPSGTYLMVQNSTGAWAKPVNRDTDIPASQVTIGGTALSSFEGCKVWLETTDKDRITKAAILKNEQVAPTGLVGGIEKITGTTSAMEYANSEASTTWITCKETETAVQGGTWYVRFKETDSKLASPAAKVEVAATTYTIEASPKEGLTFDTVNEGYTQPDAKTVTIKNTGNSPVTLNQPASTSEKFIIGALSKTGVDAGGTATFTVQPVTKLTEGTYNETIEITTAQNTKTAIDISFKVIKAPAEAPKIIKGANGVWTKGSKDGLTFQSDSPFEEFKYVLIDNKKTAASNYTVKPGSTIVTLKPEYLETLSAGKHTIAIVSENGTAETPFTIAKKGLAVPETGDNNSLYLLLTMLLLSGAGLITITLRSKSNKY